MIVNRACFLGPGLGLYIYLSVLAAAKPDQSLQTLTRERSMQQ